MAATLIVTCLGSGTGALLVDGGRVGYRDLGIPSGGPAVPQAAGAANRLLDQPAMSCCIELTLNGGRWKLEGHGQIALTGADMHWRLNGKAVDRYHVIHLDGGYELVGSTSRQEARAYFGIRGTWEVLSVLGSVEGGLPGSISLSNGVTVAVTSTTDAPNAELLPPLPVAQPLELIATTGPEWSWLTGNQQSWLRSHFTVDPRSNRQGIRLSNGDAPSLHLPSLLSSPVLPGTVQLSPAGPMLLGPDAQTVGGYPRVLLVADYAEAYRLLPGRQVRFVDWVKRRSGPAPGSR